MYNSGPIMMTADSTMVCTEKSIVMSVQRAMTNCRDVVALKQED